MTTRVHAGVDGGGTKTAVVLVDDTGVELARFNGPTSNAAVIGHDQAGAVLRGAILGAVEAAGGDITLAHIWCGLSGSDRPEDHRLLRPFICDLCPDIRMTNDAELVLGALVQAVGVAVVSGTGSIAVGRNAAGLYGRAGGWGQIMGDEGSGYDIGRRLLDAFAREADGRGPVSSCTARLNSQFSLQNPHQIITWVYDKSTSKSDIAALASIVIEEAADGDDVARQILANAAIELAQTVTALARRLGFQHHLPLALTGGMLVRNESYRVGFVECLSTTWSSLDTHVVEDPALTAAQSLASAHHSGVPA